MICQQDNEEAMRSLRRINKETSKEFVAYQDSGVATPNALVDEVIKEMRSDFHHKERVVVNKLRDPHVKERFMKTTFFYPAYPDKEVIRKQPFKVDF